MATQQERRESAIARLLDASIETIIDVGYAKASVSKITKRASLSQGALFRHFETMSDFMAATAAEALRRQHADFAARIEEARATSIQAADVLRIMREVIGSRTNAVMYELANAARTDKELQRILQAGSAAYIATVTATANSLPGLGHIPKEQLSTLVLMVIDIFDAEASMRAVRPLSGDELARRDAFLQLVYSFTLENS
ncbi:MAG: TetR family transcriptional regulator [Solirubrobacteraceae bacterium]